MGVELKSSLNHVIPLSQNVEVVLVLAQRGKLLAVIFSVVQVCAFPDDQLV